MSSQEGEGSTFVLRIPAGQRRLGRSTQESGASQSTSVPTVLVVEDEPSFVEALTIGLRREGFRVEVATDGFEALERFDVVQPDLVLLDVMLPRISGIDVCRQLRKRSQVPIIMVTAKGAEIDTVVGLEVGADDYVTKPYRLRELVARMRAVLRRRPATRPASSARRRSWSATSPSIPTSTPSLRGEPCRCRSRSSSCCTCCSPTPAGCCPATR